MKRIILLLLALFVVTGCVGSVSAQEADVDRYYILPAEDGTTGQGPKYLKWRFDADPPGLDVPWVGMKYGRIKSYLVCASVTAEQHTELSGHEDVAAAPENIDQNIGGAAVSVVQDVLEDMRIPAGWVDTSYTYRDILRRVAGLFQFSQRHYGLHNEELITSKSQLNLQWSQIPVAKKAKFQATADSFGYDYSAITGTWTVRQILMHLGDQWGEEQFIFFINNKLDCTL